MTNYPRLPLVVAPVNTPGAVSGATEALHSRI
jgi:hypothetical protein